MNNCKKCGAENLEGAAFCKECGFKFENNYRINFKSTFKRTHLLTRISFFWMIIDIPLFIFCLTSYYHAEEIYRNIDPNENPILLDLRWNQYHFYEIWLDISAIMLISIPAFIFCFTYFNFRWKMFFLYKDFSDTKSIMIQYVFSFNRTEEKIKIKENSKGELKLKDKSIGARGYFHLIEDKDGNAVLIGEKYNSQAFIRSVFGKDVNFIEN